MAVKQGKRMGGGNCGEQEACFLQIRIRLLIEKKTSLRSEPAVRSRRSYAKGAAGKGSRLTVRRSNWNCEMGDHELKSNIKLADYLPST